MEVIKMLDDGGERWRRGGILGPLVDKRLNSGEENNSDKLLHTILVGLEGEKE